MTPTTDVLNQIRARMTEFARVERRFAEHVLRDPEIEYKSITRVAEESGVAYTSIIRFCQKLGYSGFHDFKIRIAVGRGTREQRTRTHEEHWLAEALSRTTRQLEVAATAVSEETVAEAARVLASAANILTIGAAGSFPTALELTYRLVRLGAAATDESDSHMQAIRASLLSANDVLVAISSSGSTREIIEAATVAKKAGAYVLTVTSQAKSPLADLSDLILTTGLWEEPLEAEIGARLPFYFLIEVISAALLEQKPDAEEKLEQTSDSVVSRQL